MHNGYWRTHSAWIAIVAGFVTFCLPATIVSQHDANDSVTTFVASAVQDLPGSGSGFQGTAKIHVPSQCHSSQRLQENRSEFYA